MIEGYYIEQLESGLYQSVFPEAEAELSQLHSNKADAKAYIREVAGDVEIHDLA